MESYLCPAGVWTIGYGHTGPEVRQFQFIAQVRAETLYVMDRGLIELRLRIALPETVDLTQGQWDALVSLCFNMAGNPAMLQIKAPHLWHDILIGQKSQAANEFLNMDHALVNGHMEELPGLKSRRQKEAALFLS